MSTDTRTVADPALPGGDATPAERTDLVAVLAREVVPILLLLGTMVALVRKASAPLGNTDTYFHLRIGAEILDGWSIAHPGHLSRFETADWVPTQWLPQVVMAWLERHGGLATVAWLSGLQFVVLLLALYLTARRRASLLVVAPLLPIAILASSSGLSMRPQVVSYALVAVTVGAWQSVRDGGRLPWWLVPLGWLWAIYHGMWPLGIVVSIAAVVGLALDGSLRGRRLVRAAAIPVAALVAAGLTPVGPRLYGAVLLVTSRSEYFGEWGPPSFTTVPCALLLLLLVVTAVAMFRAGPARWADTALFVTALGLAVYSLRTVPVSAAMLVPLAADALQRALRQPVPGRGRRERWLVAGGAVAALGVLAAVTPHTADRPPRQPVWLEPALSALPPGSVVLSDGGFAGYLMWRFPELAYTSHGYGDVFTDSEMERNAAIEGLRPGWDAELGRLAPRIAVLRTGEALPYALVHSEGWRLLHHDRNVSLLAPPDGPAGE